MITPSDWERMQGIVNEDDDEPAATPAPKAHKKQETLKVDGDAAPWDEEEEEEYDEPVGEQEEEDEYEDADAEHEEDEYEEGRLRIRG